MVGGVRLWDTPSVAHHVAVELVTPSLLQLRRHAALKLRLPPAMRWSTHRTAAKARLPRLCAAPPFVDGQLPGHADHREGDRGR